MQSPEQLAEHIVNSYEYLVTYRDGTIGVNASTLTRLIVDALRSYGAACATAERERCARVLSDTRVISSYAVALALLEQIA